MHIRKARLPLTVLLVSLFLSNLFPKSTEPSTFGAILLSNTYENGVGTLVFDGDVKTIGENAFKDCSALTSITIQSSVTSLGENAFLYCSSLTSISIPNSVTHIGGGTFRDCSNLKEVHITDINAWKDIDFEGYYANPLYCGAKLYLNGVEVTDY